MGRRVKKLSVPPIEKGTPQKTQITADEVLVADSSFSIEDLVHQSAIDEVIIGSTDIGPTDTLDDEAREQQYYTYFGGTSPLTSVSGSAASSRSASPSRPTAPPSPKHTSFDISSPLPSSSLAAVASVLSGSSKTRRNKAKSKELRKETRRRERSRDAALKTGYKPSPEVYRKYVAPAESIKADYDVGELPTASTGYIALPDQGGRVYELQHLVEVLGFKVVKAQPGKTKVIVDKNELILAVIVGQPQNAEWQHIHRSAFNSLQASRGRCSFTKKALNHRRGNFPALNAGISYGTGQKIPGNLYHNNANAKELNRLVSLPSFKRIAGFTSKAFATWAPKLYTHYEDTLQALLSHHTHLRRNFSNSVWSAAAFNFGPQTITAKHRDFANLPYGWCGVTALGEYDHTTGGHIILWELKLVIEFPPGSTVLLPSAAISHSNTPIRRGETRASFTQFTAGGLFRWVEQGFQPKDQYVDTLSKEQRANLTHENHIRCKRGLALFSKLSDLHK